MPALLPTLSTYNRRHEGHGEGPKRAATTFRQTRTPCEKKYKDTAKGLRPGSCKSTPILVVNSEVQVHGVQTASTPRLQLQVNTNFGGEQRGASAWCANCNHTSLAAASQHHFWW